MKEIPIANVPEFDVFDNVLLFHSFAEYMRDYIFLLEIHVGDNLPGLYKCVFKYCVEAIVTTSLASEIYIASLDDKLIDYESGKHLDGYVWGVKMSRFLSNFDITERSERVLSWRQKIGLPFVQISVETDAFHICLVCTNCIITRLGSDVDAGIAKGYIPLK